MWSQNTPYSSFLLTYRKCGLSKPAISRNPTRSFPPKIFLSFSSQTITFLSAGSYNKKKIIIPLPHILWSSVTKITKTAICSVLHLVVSFSRICRKCITERVKTVSNAMCSWNFQQLKHKQSWTTPTIAQSKVEITAGSDSNTQKLLDRLKYSTEKLE